MKRILIVVIGLGLIGSGLFLYLYKDSELLSPLIGKWIDEEKKEMKVVGFLPTWMIGKTLNYTDQIDELIFLGIDVDKNGELKWDLQANKINSSEFVKMEKNLRKHKKKIVLGIKLFDAKTINLLLDDETAQQKLIDEITNLVINRKFDGVNLDFEDMGDPMRLLKDDFLKFATNLRNRGVRVSVDVFANLIIKGNGESIRKLIDNVDEVIVMGYDFHTAGSDYSGPVAPINTPVGERNLLEVVDKVAREKLNGKKIVLALPLYGYEWQTVDVNERSAVIGSGQMISMARASLMINNNEKYIVNDLRNSENKIVDIKPGELKIVYDDLAQAPRLVYKDEVEKTKKQLIKGTRKYKTINYKAEEIWQAYFEDNNSIRAKVELAKNANLGGIGFWALGYEGENSKFWDDIKDWIMMER